MPEIEDVTDRLRGTRSAKMRSGAQFQLRRFAAQSDAHFQDDPRYQLEHVTNGFASRLDDSADDTELLRRICIAYARAVADEQREPSWFQPTPWWEDNRRNSLGEVVRALRNGDTDALHRMYSNFFRDACAAGLVAVPLGDRKDYFRRPMKDVQRRAYLGDALYRLDYWHSLTGGNFNLRDLAAPNIGNPYGVLLDGTLIGYRAEYQHYCAHEILKLNSSRRVVAEFGGGYGALAYYFLRDGGKLTYVNFDVPESIALASYYLLKAFPSRKFTLYGEREVNEETIATSDVLLLPSFAMQQIHRGVVGVTLASHLLGDLSRDALAVYVDFVSRSTQDYFVYFGGEDAVASISGFLQSSRGCANPKLRASDWNRHTVPDFQEAEAIYDLSSK